MSNKKYDNHIIGINRKNKKSMFPGIRHINFHFYYVNIIRSFAYGTLCLFIGCISVGPDYEAPGTKATEQWNAALSPDIRVTDNPESMANWWSDLNDPVLTDILKVVVEQNPNLQSARARVREARARRGLAGTERFPTINLKGDATGRATSISSQPDNLTNNTSTDVTTAVITEQLRDDEPDISRQTLYTAGVDASWELDVFGGIRRSVEAADADLEASRADYRDTLVSLMAEASLSYVEFRQHQQRLAIARASLAAQEETLQMVLWRTEAGLVGQLDSEQAHQNVETTRAAIPQLELSLIQAHNRLAVLMGRQPGELHDYPLDSSVNSDSDRVNSDSDRVNPNSDRVNSDSDRVNSDSDRVNSDSDRVNSDSDRVNSDSERVNSIPVPPPELVIGIPANVLRRRPDIRSAERRLAAATARIGVAEADLYPQFTLPGSISYSATVPGSAGWTGSLGIGVRWNIFDAGAIRRNIDIQNAATEQALHQYESTVLNALEEVENALSSYVTGQNRRRSLLAATERARTAAELTEQSYRAGISDFQAVITAQQTLRSLEDDLTLNEGAIASSYIQLYKALGGEWIVENPQKD